MRIRTFLAVAVLTAGVATSLAIDIIRPFDEPRRRPQVITAGSPGPPVQCVIILCCPDECWWKQDIFKPYYLEPSYPPLED